jgi:hypothetical protein
MSQSSKYFEPSEAPEEVKNDEIKRKIKIRFRNPDDVKDFEKISGLTISTGKKGFNIKKNDNDLTKFFN